MVEQVDRVRQHLLPEYMATILPRRASIHRKFATENQIWARLFCLPPDREFHWMKLICIGIPVFSHRSDRSRGKLVWQPLQTARYMETTEVVSLTYWRLPFR
jgi:hypothetical protein